MTLNETTMKRSFEVIRKYCEAETGYSLYNKSRKHEIIITRYLFVRLAFSLTSATYEAMGHYMGGYHHSTIINLLNTEPPMPIESTLERLKDGIRPVMKRKFKAYKTRERFLDKLGIDRETQLLIIEHFSANS